MKTHRPAAGKSTVAAAHALALALVGVACLLTLPPTANASQRSNCSTQGVKTLAASKTARVYRVKTDENGYARVYACLRNRSARHLLGTDDGDFGSIYSISLAGSFVGYARCNTTSSRSAICGFGVLNLRSGRETRYLDRAFGEFANGQEAELSDLQVTPGGSVVWIDEFQPVVACEQPDRGGCRGPITRDVRLVEAGGGPRRILPGEPNTFRVLDSGPGIAKTSLHRRGSRVYWFRDGQRRSARVS